MNASFPLQHPARAFSLVEATIALGIAVFCLVVIFGLLSVGVNMSSVSIEQTTATNLLAGIASDIRTAPKPLPTDGTTVYHIKIPANAPPAASPLRDVRPDAAPLDLTSKYLDACGRPVETANQARYQLGGWMRAGNGRDATIACLRLTWPASAAPSNSAGRVETLVALERN